jgi:hypothetical protein
MEHCTPGALAGNVAALLIEKPRLCQQHSWPHTAAGCSAQAPPHPLGPPVPSMKNEDRNEF